MRHSPAHAVRTHSLTHLLTHVRTYARTQLTCSRSAHVRTCRGQAALFTARYAAALELLRAKGFKATDKGVPLEWFTWERIIIDECHESLVMGQVALVGSQ